MALFCRKELRVCGRRQLTLSSQSTLRLVSLPLLDTILPSKQTGWQPDDAIRIWLSTATRLRHASACCLLS